MWFTIEPEPVLPLRQSWCRFVHCPTVWNGIMSWLSETNAGTSVRHEMRQEETPWPRSNLLDWDFASVLHYTFQAALSYAHFWTCTADEIWYARPNIVRFREKMILSQMATIWLILTSRRSFYCIYNSYKVWRKVSHKKKAQLAIIIWHM